MSEPSTRTQFTTTRIAYPTPGHEQLTVVRDVPYGESPAGPLSFDVYLPAVGETRQPSPVVLFVNGYSDVGMRTMLGCAAKDMASWVSWAQLLALSGIAVVTGTVARPVEDAAALLDTVRRRGASLGLDVHRLGLWACSGHVPNALALLMADAHHTHAPRIRCAVLLYGYTLDLGGSTAVADAASTFRFANPSAGSGVDDLPADVGLFVARAGLDQTPGLNAALDAFVTGALARDLPLTLVNHPQGPHAFDILRDQDDTRRVIAQALAFLRGQLDLAALVSPSST